MNKLYFITGASGAGKTTVIKLLEKEDQTKFAFCYFDSIGVPTFEEMNDQFGSPENWQKTATNRWVERIKIDHLPTKQVIFDGQMRLSFITKACLNNQISNYQIILFDCNDEERAERLIARGHPELANPDMMKWAEFLRLEAKELNVTVVDTTSKTERESLEFLKAILTNTV